MRKKNIYNLNFFDPAVHKIRNSLFCRCFIIKIVKAIKKENGMNLGAIPKRFKKEYLK